MALSSNIPFAKFCFSYSFLTFLLFDLNSAYAFTAWLTIERSSFLLSGIRRMKTTSPTSSHSIDLCNRMNLFQFLYFHWRILDRKLSKLASCWRLWQTQLSLRTHCIFQYCLESVYIEKISLAGILNSVMLAQWQYIVR